MGDLASLTLNAAVILEISVQFVTGNNHCTRASENPDAKGREH